MRLYTKPTPSNNWRASLVPAAAVTPAPIAYIKVVALKKLVVRLPRAPLLWRRPALWVGRLRPQGVPPGPRPTLYAGAVSPMERTRFQHGHVPVSKSECSKQALCALCMVEHGMTTRDSGCALLVEPTGGHG